MTHTVEFKDLEPALERHRGELTGYCRRMLGSAFDAEDAVQETLARAWRAFDGFEHRASLRSWLYRIATNVCLDMRRAGQRRARPMEVAFSKAAEPHASVTHLADVRPQAVLHRGALPADDPAELAASRETIRFAFGAALHHLPPRQRAVLILRDVLRWKADEVAELLGSTVASVNSALHRARARLHSSNVASSEPPELRDFAQRRLLARYVDAFERYDVETLIALAAAEPA